MFAADNPFLPQARLAARVLRSVAKEPDLALKGGTAINLFFRDLPRLSVDLDLTYLRIRDREESLNAIGEALERVAADVRKTLRGARVERRGLRDGMDAFVVYLVSHGRPMSEVLAPVEKDLRQLHEAEFANMVGAPVTVEALQEARARLVRELRQTLLPRHVQFLRSVKGLDPEWALLPHAHVAELPAVRWRLQNLERFQKEQPERYVAVRNRLEEVLKEFHGR